MIICVNSSNILISLIPKAVYIGCKKNGKIISNNNIIKKYRFDLKILFIYILHIIFFIFFCITFIIPGHNFNEASKLPQLIASPPFYLYTKLISFSTLVLEEIIFYSNNSNSFWTICKALRVASILTSSLSPLNLNFLTIVLSFTFIAI